MFEVFGDASHVKASEQHFSTRDLQPSGSNGNGPRRARLLHVREITGSIPSTKVPFDCEGLPLLDKLSTLARYGVCGGHVEEAGSSRRARRPVTEEAAF